MVRVRFAPSPTGSLHAGNALSAVANRRFADEHGGALLLRIDDTDAARTAAGAEQEILADLEWLGVRWDEGPLRESERIERHREAAASVRGARRDAEGALRFDGVTLLRADGTPTYHLASVVDDLDLGVTHVIRGADLRPSTALHERLARALGGDPPEYVHHGLLLGENGAKLSKRAPLATLAELRAAGIPGEAVRAYLEELGLPRGDVRYDVSRIRRLAVEAIAALDDAELAARAGIPVEAVPAARGARTLAEAREWARSVLEPEPAALPAAAAPTLLRFRELREPVNGALDLAGARSIVRELKAVGGDLRALRLALTGRERGPELAAVIAALPPEEALRRVDAAVRPEPR